MKRIAMFLVLAGFIAGSLAAQEQFPDLKRYFMIANQLTSPNWDFEYEPLIGDNPADSARFSNITGKLNVIDSYLEFALLTYYSTAERAWAERGNAVLPLNNPRLVDRQLGAYVYKDLIVYRFLNDTAAVNRHEAMLQFITGRGNATRAEIETFYRNNIRALVSQVVDEEFNKVSFMIDRNYNAILIRNPQNGQYTLSYEGVGHVVKELSVASLEALSSAMRNSGDFSNTAFDTVRAQASLIPAVALSSADIQAAKNELTNFLLTPNADTLLALRRRYRNFALTQGERSDAASSSLYKAVSSFSEGLAVRMTAN